MMVYERAPEGRNDCPTQVPRSSKERIYSSFNFPGGDLRKQGQNRQNVHNGDNHIEHCVRKNKHDHIRNPDFKVPSLGKHQVHKVAEYLNADSVEDHPACVHVSEEGLVDERSDNMADLGDENEEGKHKLRDLDHVQ